MAQFLFLIALIDLNFIDTRENIYFLKSFAKIWAIFDT